MARVIRAKQDFVIERAPGRIHLTFYAAHRGFLILGFVLAFLCLIGTILSGIFALFALSAIGRLGVLTFLLILAVPIVFAILTGFAFYWGMRTRAQTLELDEEGITKGPNKYVFEDIEGISWQFGVDNPTMVSQSTALTIDFLRYFSGVVFANYGNRNYPLVTGLQEDATRRAFRVVVDSVREINPGFELNAEGVSAEL